MKRFLLIVSLLFGSFYQEYAIAASEDDEEISDDDSENSQSGDENEASENDGDEDEDIDEEQRQQHVDNIVDNLVGIDGNNVSRARGAATNKLMSENEQLKNEIKKLKKEIAKGGKSLNRKSTQISGKDDSEDDDYEAKPQPKSKKRSSSQNVSKRSARKGSWRCLKKYPASANSSRARSANGSSRSFFTIKNLSSIKNIRAYVPNYSQSNTSRSNNTTQEYPIHSYVVKSFATGEKIPFENSSPSRTVKQNYFSNRDCKENCR